MLIQKLRLQRGWSQQQLADLSGLSVRTIQRLERGQGASVESLKSLAAVFETDFSTLQIPTESTMHVPSHQGLKTEEILAFEHVRALRKFYFHAIQYVVVIAALAIINFVASPHKLWFYWPALGWGIALIGHALRVFEVLPYFGADWEKKQVEKRLGRSL
jgi:transcriptional regulator with XRE-family HTH domain